LVQALPAPKASLDCLWAIWRVKSASRRLAADFQRKSGLDATNRPVMLLEAVWWTTGITKTLPDKLPIANLSFPPERELRAGTSVCLRIKIRDSAAPSGMTGLSSSQTPHKKVRKA